jgi:hypothetical protein
MHGGTHLTKSGLGGELSLPSLDIARLDPDRIGARRAQYFKVQESSAL